MKKICKITAICVVISIVLSSCSATYSQSNPEQTNDTALQIEEETSALATIPESTVQQYSTEETTATEEASSGKISFQQIGEQKQLALENAPEDDVFWSSDDLTVAMVADGKVVATGAGETVVHAFYGG